MDLKKELKPKINLLSKKNHIDKINDLFESLYVEFIHSQKQNKKRSPYLRRSDSLKIRSIDGTFLYPLSKDIVEVCKRLDIELPDDYKINHSHQMRINRELKKKGHSSNIMIEHIGGGIKELLKIYYRENFDKDLAAGIEQVRNIHYEHTFCFYRFRLGNKINGATSFNLTKAMEAIS